MFGVSSSLGVEGVSSSLHLREAELTTGLALVDLVEVVLAEVGLATEDVETAHVEEAFAIRFWSSTITDVLGLPSRLIFGKESPVVERSSGASMAVSTQGLFLDCTLAGRPLGRNLTKVGFTILPSSFFYKEKGVNHM